MTTQVDLVMRTQALSSLERKCGFLRTSAPSSIPYHVVIIINAKKYARILRKLYALVFPDFTVTDEWCSLPLPFHNVGKFLPTLVSSSHSCHWCSSFCECLKNKNSLASSLAKFCSWCYHVVRPVYYAWCIYYLLWNIFFEKYFKLVCLPEFS